MAANQTLALSQDIETLTTFAVKHSSHFTAQEKGTKEEIKLILLISLTLTQSSSYSLSLNQKESISK